MAVVNKVCELSDQEFNVIRRMVYESIGVNLTDAKRMLVVSRLTKRLRNLGLGSFAQYLDFLRQNPAEVATMFNCITTNVTKFFREEQHFAFLRQEYLPRLEVAAKGQAGKKIRVWSAGCATGEEPYTLAMVFHHFFAGKNGWDIKILASDVNTETLEKARKGVYSRQEVENVPFELLKKYFKLGTGSNQGYFKIKEVLQSLVEFRRINLTASQDYPISEPLDIVFCRNVFIYFDKETQSKVLQRYHSHLKPKGLLFLGHSESINTTTGLGNNWRQVGHTVYERLP